MKSVVALSVLLALSTSPITQGRDNSRAVQNSLVIDRCVELASVKFRIHSDLLRAILLTEGGELVLETKIRQMGHMTMATGKSTTLMSRS